MALLIIGIAASTGAFNAIGTTNAAHLSYGMYAGAALLLAIEIAKLVRNYCFKDSHSDDSHNQGAPRLGSENNPKSTPKFRGPVPHDYVSPPVKRSEPLSQGAIQNLKEQAATYASVHARLNPGATMEQVTEQLIVYMLTIIDDKEFQKDPTAYMEAWIKERGSQENHISPDDDARKFFKNLSDPTHLRWQSSYR